MDDPRLILEINDLDLLQGLIQANSIVVVEFGASWCAPCRAFLPHFTKFAEKHPEVTCVKVDIDEDARVLEAFGIMSVPQVLLFRNGKYVEHLKARTVLQLEKEIV